MNIFEWSDFIIKYLVIDEGVVRTRSIVSIFEEVYIKCIPLPNRSIVGFLC